MNKPIKLKKEYTYVPTAIKYVYNNDTTGGQTLLEAKSMITALGVTEGTNLLSKLIGYMNLLRQVPSCVTLCNLGSHATQ